MFSAAEKLRIVRAAAACTERGSVEALLRREGIYSSLLAAWRKQLGLHGADGLAGRKPGRKAKMDAKDRRIAELEKRTAKLDAKLVLAGKLLDSSRSRSDLPAQSWADARRTAARQGSPHGRTWSQPACRFSSSRSTR